MGEPGQRYCYEYPRPAVTVDVVVFATVQQRPSVLLVRRAEAPFQGCWAIPGGFVEMDESLEAAAQRELAEETGVRDVAIEQIGAFGDPDRDPRGRTITVAYGAVIYGAPPAHQAGSDAAEAQWFPVDALPKLAFDHDLVLRTAIERVRGRLTRPGLA